MDAFDNANPEKSAQSSIIVQVDIDRENPVFDVFDYVFNTDEKQPVPNVVGVVSATDDDLRGEIWYEINGEFPGDVFFDVNKTTGQVYIRTDLMRDGDATESYTVSVQVHCICLF